MGQYEGLIITTGDETKVVSFAITTKINKLQR
jgi:hypothetical protein